MVRTCTNKKHKKEIITGPEFPGFSAAVRDLFLT
ncbi:hypothetical protein CJA_0322 [Cellvibrio japonicus Ueda107]|uniref:Uncharacterized protein n=1 Tax=Cellvibrio japonicus (strain Ueda107) TaxID=498211 RepID=B3PHC5_CELJU|nr:hypothetical protein CJA_0322 [Cellvibrio japonicus Ueda107]